MSVFDSNALQDFSHTFSGFMWKGVADVHRTPVVRVASAGL